MKCSCFIILYLFSFYFFAQNSRELDSLKLEIIRTNNDSLKKALLKDVFNKYLFIDLDSAKVYHDRIVSTPETDKISIIEKLALSSKFHYYSSNLDSALHYTEKALAISLEIRDSKLTADLYRKMAILSSRSFDYESAEKYGVLALEKANETKDWELIASSNLMIGNQFYKKNDFDIALQYYITVDSLYGSNYKTDRYLALCYDNIASIYTDIKDEKALEYIDKGKDIYKALGDQEGLHYNYNLRGIYFQRIEEIDTAIKNYEKALRFFSDYGNNFREIDVSYRLVTCYSISGHFNKGEELFKRMESKTDGSLNDESLYNFYSSGGDLYLNQNKYETAIKYFNKANEFFNYDKIEYSVRQRQYAFQGLANAYFGAKNYKKAFEALNTFKNITDSIYLKNSLEITKGLETKYQTEKKEQEIALLKSEKELSNQKQKSERSMLFGGLAFTSVAGVFLFLLFRDRQKVNKKLTELDKAKSNFFANISHEFRTPLTLICNPIDEALKDDLLSSIKREQFVMAKRNSDRLLSLVNQLLDLSKIDAGQLKLRIQKGNIQNIISGLAESFNYLAKQKKLSYHLKIDKSNKESWFDKDALEKITINLLSNAFKYTPKNGSITCTSLIENNALQLSVKNTGIGFNKNELENIFTRFYQTDEQNEGTGIGLALVKELVELHKGVIKVDSKAKEWICFTVILPIDKKSFKEEAFVSSTEIKSNYKTQNLEGVVAEDEVFEVNEKPILLIVEDNIDVRALLKQNFEADYNILTAENGQIGSDLAIEHVPDIIISDIMMPVKNGVSLTNELKNNELTSHIPIILLTAKAGDENEIKGLEIGADDYITKPFSSKVLKTKVLNLINIRRKLQSRYSQEVVLSPKDIAVTNLDQKFLEKIQEVLENKLVESSFSVGDFSDAVGMSRMQLHRKIKALTGLSTSEFIRSQRLKLAADLLKTSNINISQVGYSVGFNDHSYFAKCFKNVFNCTPTEYAKKYQTE
ncbi:hypothetical protein GCM10022291_00980 [Postechiella marina]|uniref:histidine kinase n=1 Tax=Postechiella marina TaxID=943941 RepID=A0ABP8BZ29_9FLAO